MSERKTHEEESEQNRRTFLRTSVRVSTAALGAALLPYGRVWASDAPEISALKFGMIALTDCSPIVIAHEKGLLQEIRHQRHGQPKARAGRRSATRFPTATSRPRTCCSACRSPRRWACSVRRRSRWSFRGCSTATARRSRSRPSSKGKVAGRSQGAQAARRRGQGGGHADDVRDDVSARHARDVDALLPRPPAASIPTRTSR